MQRLLVSGGGGGGGVEYPGPLGGKKWHLRPTEGHRRAGMALHCPVDHQPQPFRATASKLFTNIHCWCDCPRRSSALLSPPQCVFSRDRLIFPTIIIQIQANQKLCQGAELINDRASIGGPSCRLAPEQKQRDILANLHLCIVNKCTVYTRLPEMWKRPHIPSPTPCPTPSLINKQWATGCKAPRGE